MSDANKGFCLKMMPCECGESGVALPDLSYDEQYAGYHDVNGDRVYVKTVYFPQLPNADNDRQEVLDVSHGVENYKRLVKLDVTWIAESSSSGSMSKTNPADCMDIRFWVLPTVVRSVVRNSDRSGMQAYATIYYTCTDR